VLLDVDEYEALLERVELLQEVQTAERQLASGQGITHEDAEARVLSHLSE
jgi:antitoxin YefM